MRYSLLTFLLLALFLVPTHAQEAPKRIEWEFRVGVNHCALDRYNYMNAEICPNNGNNSGHILPTFSASAGLILPNIQLGFFMNVYYSYAFNTLTGGPSPLYEKEGIWNFAPEVRVYYSIMEKWRFYASAGPSFRYRHYWETYNEDTQHDRVFNVTWHFSPIGVSFGKNWFVSMDFGFWYVAKVNFGYRF